MKLLYATFLLMFFPLISAHAYLEVAEEGDAKATSIEQTSSFYQLHSKTDMQVKKLKSINNALVRNPNLANTMGMVELEHAVVTDTEEGKRHAFMKKTLADTKKTLSDKNKLVQRKDGNFYVQLTNMVIELPKRDASVVKTLKKSLRRG